MSAQSVSSTPSRPALRDEQVRRTRERLLDAALDIMITDGVRELTVNAVAERANVSRRTAYRYFPTQESLFEAVNEKIATRPHYPQFPNRLESLPEYMDSLFAAFSSDEQLTRAQVRSAAAGALRARRKPQQARFIEELAEQSLGENMSASVRGRLAIIHALSGSDAYVMLREVWGLSPDECREQLASAVSLLFADIAAALKNGEKSGSRK